MNSVSDPMSVDELFELYDTLGERNYGESITQSEHALQSAALARDAGASDALMVAALFHDVGHLALDVQGESESELSSHDDDHEARGARILARLFGPRVAQPVALHVTAKRWRCTRRPRVSRPAVKSITGDTDRAGWFAKRRGVSAIRATPWVRRCGCPSHLGRHGQN